MPIKINDQEEYDVAEKAVLEFRSKKPKAPKADLDQAPAPKKAEALDVEDQIATKSPSETEEYEYKCSSCNHEFNGQLDNCPNCSEPLEWSSD